MLNWPGPMLTRRSRPPLQTVSLHFPVGISRGRVNVHDGEDLEEIVLGKVLVRVMGMQLETVSQVGKTDEGNLQSKSY